MLDLYSNLCALYKYADKRTSPVAHGRAHRRESITSCGLVDPVKPRRDRGSRDACQFRRSSLSK
jgi:hypothetical protein